MWLHEKNITDAVVVTPGGNRSVNFGAKKIDFPADAYVNKKTEKSIFVIHHSAGWDNAEQMFNIWRGDEQGRVATAFGVVDNGVVVQGFDTEFWAYALKVNEKHEKRFKALRTPAQDTLLNSKAIQIEICNWGNLQLRDGVYYAWPNDYGKGPAMKNGKRVAVVVDPAKVVTYDKPFRGAMYYEKYTEAEINAVYVTIQECIKAHPKITRAYHEDMWDVSERALRGESGVWTHVSYRDGKVDCHPQEDLIYMLKNL